MKRYLVLVHLAAKIEKADLATRATALLRALQQNLDNMETVLTAEKAFAFAGTSHKTANELWTLIGKAAALARQDNITVLEVGSDICTTHLGFQKWNLDSGMLAGLAELARRK